MSLVVNGLLWGANVSAVTLSSMMKLPQLYSLAKSQSSKGLSLPSIILELTGYCIMMSYFIQSSYPLEAFMEYPMLVAQDIIALLLFLYFRESSGILGLAPFGVYFSFIGAISLGYFPKHLIAVLVNLCTPLSASSKLVQFYAIVSTRDSKGVSVLTWSISAYTSIARLFTVYIETFDVALMINFGVAFTLNLLVITAATIFAPQEEQTASEKKKE